MLLLQHKILSKKQKPSETQLRRLSTGRETPLSHGASSLAVPPDASQGPTQASRGERKLVPQLFLLKTQHLRVWLERGPSPTSAVAIYLLVYYTSLSGDLYNQHAPPRQNAYLIASPQRSQSIKTMLQLLEEHCDLLLYLRRELMVELRNEESCVQRGQKEPEASKKAKTRHPAFWEAARHTSGSAAAVRSRPHALAVAVRRH